MKKYSALCLLLLVWWRGYSQADLVIGSNYTLNLQRQNSNADAFILHNARADAFGNYIWQANHASFGSRGILMQYFTGIHFFADATPTALNSTFTPTTRFFI